MLDSINKVRLIYSLFQIVCYQLRGAFAAFCCLACVLSCDVIQGLVSHKVFAIVS